MHRNCLLVGVALLVALLFASGAQALEIFVWQHDNGLLVNDPVFGASLTATQALTQTLDSLDLAYDLNTALPNDLSGYDIVMTCLSFYCPG